MKLQRHPLVLGGLFLLLGCGGRSASGGRCGNGALDNWEDCDGALVAPPLEETANCRHFGGRDVPVPCTDRCVLDLGYCDRIGECGDGVLQPEFEVCEGDDLAGATCESLGFYGGQLTCVGCTWLDTYGCWRCGDGVVQPEYGEVCDRGSSCRDLGFLEGQLQCTDCAAPVTSRCSPGRMLSTLGDHHQITAAGLFGGQTFWRLGFTVGALPDHVNAAAGCPERFLQQEEAGAGFVSDAWNPALRLDGCLDLFLEAVSPEGEVSTSVQWGSAGADVPAVLADTGQGELAVVSWQVPDPSREAPSTVTVALGLFQPSRGTLETRPLVDFPVFLPAQRRAPVLTAGVSDGVFSILIDTTPDAGVPSLRVLSGGVRDPGVRASDWSAAELAPGQQVTSVELLKATTPAPGHHLVQAVVHTVEAPDGDGVNLLFLLSEDAGGIRLAWVRELGAGRDSLIFFAAPEFSGAGVWALDALEFRTALTMDPARQWRLTPLSATLEVASVRTGLSEPPLLAVRLGHDWLLTGTGPTGVTMPVHPFIGVNNILWQLVAPRDAWPTVGQGWGHEAFTPVTCFQERLPDGSWVLTGSPTHEVPSDRTFWVHFPPL